MRITPETNSAGGFILNPNNEVLLVEEFGQFWGLPRGHVENSEDKIDAAKREIREETGIANMEFCFELGSYTRSTFDKNGIANSNEIKHLTFFCFRTTETAIRPQDPDITGAGWFDFEEAGDKLINTEDIVFFRASVKKVRKRLRLA